MIYCLHRNNGNGLEIMSKTILDEYVTREELARELGVAYRTIGRWQSLPDGLPRVRLFGKTLYRLESVKAWIRGREEFPNPTHKRRAA